MQGMLARAATLASQQQQGAIDGLLTEEGMANKSLAESVIGMRKGIRDARTAEEAQAQVEYTTAIDGLKEAFASVIGSTPEETDWIISLAEEMAVQTAALGESRVRGVKDVLAGVQGALRQFADDPTIWEGMQSNLITQMDQLGIEDELIRGRLVDQVNSLDDIFGIVQSLLEYDPYLNLMSNNLSDVNSVYNFLVGSSGGNSPTGDSPAFASEGSTTIDGLASGGSSIGSGPAAGSAGTGGGLSFNKLEKPVNSIDEYSDNPTTTPSTVIVP
jgi:hypothetical protein